MVIVIKINMVIIKIIILFIIYFKKVIIKIIKFIKTMVIMVATIFIYFNKIHHTSLFKIIIRNKINNIIFGKIKFTYSQIIFKLFLHTH